jgi:hypothetical protein
MSNFLPKIGLGIILNIAFFIPIIGIAVIFNLSNACIWGMLIGIIIFTASLSDEGAITLMNSFAKTEIPVEKRKKCSFCGENHDDDDCYYMGIDDLAEGGVL